MIKLSDFRLKCFELTYCPDFSFDSIIIIIVVFPCYCVGNSLLSGVQITASGGRMVKVPSTFLRHVSGKMLIPGSNLTLLDCIGQGEWSE